MTRGKSYMNWVKRLQVISALLLAAPGFAADAVRSEGASPSTGAVSISDNDLAAFNHAKISIREAMSAAQAHTNGGVVEANFDASTGAALYKVRTLDGTTIWEGDIDAHSGRIVDARTIPINELDEGERAELDGVVRVPTGSLLQAVKLAEERTGGKVISAEVEEVNRRNAYELIVVKEGMLQRLVYRSHYH
jgi:uncharacterized membrane protein YkoI